MFSEKYKIYFELIVLGDKFQIAIVFYSRFILDRRIYFQLLMWQYSKCRYSDSIEPFRPYGLVGWVTISCLRN